jgi:hypothetical protein
MSYSRLMSPFDYFRFPVDWMRRQPQARQTKQKARIDAFYKLEKSTKPRVRDPSLDLGEEGQRRLGGNILKVSVDKEERKVTKKGLSSMRAPTSVNTFMPPCTAPRMYS